MNIYFITLKHSTNTYDLVTEASSPEDLIRQISAMNVAAKVLGGTRFELTDFSTSRTRGRDYVEFGKWIVA
jgi:hypothetical protein